MQFKKVKNKIQVLAYRGYDKEKKRGNVVMVGSLDADTLKFSPSVRLKEKEDKLTVEEKTELQAYTKSVRQEREKESAEKSLRGLSRTLEEAKTALMSGAELCEDEARGIWAEIEGLGRELRRRGLHQRRLLRGGKDSDINN